MRRSTIVAIVAAFTAGGLIGAVAATGRWPAGPAPALSAPHPAWTEIAWPFPLDEWGRGKAFRCGAADCGTDTELYIRAKIGFCNCTTGVADDAELDRLSDFRLMGGKIANLGAGHAIDVAWMQGRARAFAIAAPVRSGRSALSLAVNDHCDAIVATVVLGHDRPAMIEPGVLAFLNGKTVLGWAETALGL